MCSDIYLMSSWNIDYEVGMHDQVLDLFHIIAFIFYKKTLFTGVKILQNEPE